MIECVSENNLDEVLPLIRQYQEFYRVEDISDENNRNFFVQFGKGSPHGCQFLYRHSGDVVGFATVYFSFASSIIGKVAVLNDLFAIEEMRGRGIGRQLIEVCREYASLNGAKRLQWVTAPDNAPAKKLYDSLNTNRSTWDFYTYAC